MNCIKTLFGLFLIAMLVQGAMAADVTTLDPGTSTSWDVWILSGIAGIILFIMSLNTRTNPSDVEVDATYSVIAWVPTLFCAYASFNVSRITGTGYVTLYSMPVVGILMGVFFIVEIANTLRIVALHRTLKGERRSD